MISVTPSFMPQPFSARYRWLEDIKPERRLLRGKAYLIAKRLMDLAIVLSLLPVELLVIGVCALLLKLEDPTAAVFFTQIRTGKGGRPFKMYKFRTMVTNAEELKKQLEHLNELRWPDFKIKDDPRITPLGGFLRRTSLDELPQLFNILRGEMSLVGPRPTSFSAATYALWQTERLDVLPGLTGLWQIFGRGSSDFDERLRMDIAYIERRCLWLDVQILARTVIAVLEQRGAH
jgi:lipopolysaccharide/colanic/teichoic acid biosynthesis glycosyltransferase